MKTKRGHSTSSGRAKEAGHLWGSFMERSSQSRSLQEASNQRWCAGQKVGFRLSRLLWKEHAPDVGEWGAEKTVQWGKPPFPEGKRKKRGTKANDTALE